MFNEFSLIKTYFAPLAEKEPGALGLQDDTALLAPRPGYSFAITKDAITENVHFFSGDDPYKLAQKLLRVNISDLAAMGAIPHAYLLALILPRSTSEQWLQDFSAGLAADQEEFGITLIGGDTVSHNGPLSLTLTALGEVEEGKSLKRSSARVGDGIYVSGTIGDSALGLAVLKGELDTEHKEFLTGRYYVPQPRVALGRKLIGVAHAAMDISDGLLQDLGHIASTSQMGAIVYADKVPLSQAAEALLAKDATLLERVITGGDDYELLFTVPADKEPLIAQIAAELKFPLTKIGVITAGEEIKVLNQEGQEIKVTYKGYQHFRK